MFLGGIPEAAASAAMWRAAHGMWGSTTSATMRSATAAPARSSRPRIGSARDSGDHGSNGENLDVWEGFDV